jgi:hypothetical protein
MSRAASTGKSVYRVRMRCVTVDTLDVSGTNESEAVQAAIETFERRALGYEAVETITIETQLIEGANEGERVPFRDPLDC